MKERISKIGERGVTVVPKEFREFMKIKTGDYIKWSVKGKNVIVSKV